MKGQTASTALAICCRQKAICYGVSAWVTAFQRNIEEGGGSNHFDRARLHALFFRFFFIWSPVLPLEKQGISGARF